jgi:plastocyanin
MSLRTSARVTACVALLALGGGLTACAASGGEPARTFKPNELQVIEPAGQEAKWTYAPAVLKVAKGTAVSIVNRGKEFHTVTSDDPGRPFDISIDADKTATFTFGTVGSFAYHCGVHPQMTGVVQVCDGPCP